ncbi:MAG: hypothetical protein QM768_06075 [Agriterribacter sp.]
MIFPVVGEGKIPSPLFFNTIIPMLKIAFLPALLFIIITSCINTPRFKNDEKRIEALNSMQQADIDFSNRSKEAGMKKAFLEYMDEEGVMLRPQRMPVIGAAAVDLISSLNDSSLILTWHPIGANMSKAADLGYTYGIYTMQMGDATYKGTYVTIWQKQEDGSWKFLLDSGNEGTGE